MKRWAIVLMLLGLLKLPCSGLEQPKYIALTFDDGPSGKYTARLLDGLASREVHATFFLCGYRVEQYPELTARIASEGHEIGTHGDAHAFFNALSPEGVCEDLARAAEKIKAAGGGEPKLLRPPGGLYDAEVLRRTVCAELPIILWSIDSGDWHRSDSDGVAQSIIRQAKSGDIVLMHDMSDSSVSAALKTVDALEAEGFVFVTVSELAFLARQEMQGGEVYHHFSFHIPAKKASISERSAATEPCAKVGFPPPRPCSAPFSARTVSRRSQSGAPMAYL